MANIAYGPGDMLFGAPVDRRILHSVRSASLETGLHPKRLKKMLVAAHIAPEEQRDWMDDHIIFDAQNAAPMLEKFVGAMTLGEAAKYRRIPRPHDAILARSGVLPALASELLDRAPLRGVTEAWPPRISGLAGLVSVRGLPAS